MRHKILFWAGVCLTAAFFTGCGKAAKAPGKITCYCFLNEHPCESSRRLEAWTKDALEAAYAPELQSGRLTYKSVNYDRLENAHYFKDYKLPFQSIVLQDEGDPKRWMRLDKLWEMIGDQAEFRKYTQEQAGKFLSGEKP